MTSKFHYRFPERFVTHLEGTQAYADMGIAEQDYTGAQMSALHKLFTNGSLHQDGSIHVRQQLTGDEILWLVTQAEMLEMCGQDNNPQSPAEGMADIRAARAAIRSLNKGYWRS